MPRNRQQTEGRILGAALKLLQEQGFEAWGVNVVARTAGIDKVLIYRYFGSLEGLLEAIIAQTTFWPDPENLPSDSPEAFIAATMEAIDSQPHIHALLAHPVARKAISAIRGKFTGDLELWLAGFRRHARGSIPGDQLERLPALLHYQASTGRRNMSPRDLWQQVSPPLEWQGEKSGWSAFEELPTELL
jgi:AcrR family transcriptional regulator